jgi:hypothetical protein
MSSLLVAVAVVAHQEEEVAVDILKDLVITYQPTHTRSQLALGLLKAAMGRVRQVTLTVFLALGAATVMEWARLEVSAVLAAGRITSTELRLVLLLPVKVAQVALVAATPLAAVAAVPVLQAELERVRQAAREAQAWLILTQAQALLAQAAEVAEVVPVEVQAAQAVAAQERSTRRLQMAPLILAVVAALLTQERLAATAAAA